MVEILLSLLTLATVSANQNDYKQKCLKRLVCTNYIENSEGKMAPNNSEFFNLQLQASCHLSPQEVDVRFYGNNNLTFTVKNNPTILTNCSAADIDSTLAYNKENCDLKKQQLLELRIIAQKEPYQKIENGQIVHICDEPDEIIGPADYLKKTNRQMELGRSISFNQIAIDNNPWNSIEYSEDNCLKCSQLSYIDDDTLVRKEGTNECERPDGCPAGMKRVPKGLVDAVKSKLDQVSNFSGGFVGGSFGGMDSTDFDQVSEETGEIMSCFPECTGGSQFNLETLSCELNNCEELYSSLTSHLKQTPSLPSQLGDCDQQTLQTLWIDYTEKARAYAQTQKSKCNNLYQNKSSNNLLKASSGSLSRAQGISPYQFNSLSFAQVALPLCGVISNEEILSMDPTVFDQVNIKPDGYSPTYNSTKIIGKLYEVNLENNSGMTRITPERSDVKSKKPKAEPNKSLGYPTKPISN